VVFLLYQTQKKTKMPWSPMLHIFEEVFKYPKFSKYLNGI